MALCWRISSKGLSSLLMAQCGKQLFCLDLSFCNLDDSVVSHFSVKPACLSFISMIGCEDTDGLVIITRISILL